MANNLPHSVERTAFFMRGLVVSAALLLLLGCNPTGPNQVTGDLSRDELSQITTVVHEELASRNRSGRIKTVSATNDIVEVWYADKQARWGEAGLILERQANHWRITTNLSR